MLALLKRHGWSIDRPDAFAGDGVFLIATREWREARGAGKSLGAAVAALVADVATFYGVRQLKSA